MSSVRGVGRSTHIDETSSANSVSGPQAETRPSTSPARPTREENRIERAGPDSSAPPAAEAKVRADVKAGLEAALTNSWDNFVVGCADVDRAHALLGQLSPAEYRAAMKWMDETGLLGRLIDTADASQRDRFLDQAWKKGFISAQPEAPVDAPLDPPARPAVFITRGDLPVSVREAIHEHAIGAGNGYFREYEAYLDRYEAAALKAKSGADIRALGQAVPTNFPDEPGLTYGHPDYERFLRDRTDRVGRTDGFRAERAINNRLADLRGELRPGTLFIDAKVEAEDAIFKVESERKVALDSSGTVLGKDRATATPALFGGAVEQNVDGSVTVGAAMRADIAGHKYEESVDRTGASKKTIEVPGFKYEKETDAKGKSKEALELGVVGMKISESSMAVSVKAVKGVAVEAEADSESAEFVARGKFDLGGDKKLEAGVGFRGLSRDAARHALNLSNPGVYAVPAELRSGIHWDDLPAANRAIHERNLWTRDEWERAIARGKEQ